MKLLTKTTLYFITISLFVFFAGGLGLYILMQNLVKNEVDAELLQRIHYVFNQIDPNDSLGPVHFIASEPIDIEKIHLPKQSSTFRFQDTVLFNDLTKTYAPYRELISIVKAGPDYYRIRIYKSLITSNTLIEKVALVTTLMLMLFLLLAYFLNRYLFSRVWFDFFATLHKIQEFSLTMPQKEAFSASEIIEFNELNRLLNKMTDKIINDYEGLKEFTGNLSHEVQTPLAVIKNKTELMMQEPLNKQQYEQIGSIYSAANRLSAIVRSLGLIARIDNNQFTETQPVNFKDLILLEKENYEPLMESRGIKIETEFSGQPDIQMNKELAEILVNNLIKNAVRHNLKNGFIRIHLSKQSLTISNSGENPGIPTEKLFDQFSRGSDKGFMGIGLSIVRKITEHYGMSVRYDYQDQQHKITVGFQPS
ncbi:MAG: HAMP domain-containing histidine kinase [Bacteroidales bacterium]|nr:HAMP domain-containing histidine kinase [Bacteroidales bacterium]